MTAADTTPQVFQQTVERHPERVAMRQKTLGLWHDISWQAYFENVRCLGSALVALGYDPSDAGQAVLDEIAKVEIAIAEMKAALW